MAASVPVAVANTAPPPSPLSPSPPPPPNDLTKRQANPNRTIPNPPLLGQVGAAVAVVAAVAVAAKATWASPLTPRGRRWLWVVEGGFGKAVD